MQFGENACQKDHTVYPVLTEQLQGTDFSAAIICSIDQQQFKAFLAKDFADSFGNTGDAFA